MKADKDYVYMGQFYLTGAEMPEGWTPPAASPATPGVTIHGPDGVLTATPPLALPPNITAPPATHGIVATQDAPGARVTPIAKGK